MELNLKAEGPQLTGPPGPGTLLICVGYSVTFKAFKPRPNALDFSLYIARQMSSIVECCREGVAKRFRLFTRLGTQHSTDVLLDE